MGSNIAKFEADLKRKGQEKFVRNVTELYKSVVLQTFQYITADSLQVGKKYGSPVLTGRFYASHTINIGRIDTKVKPENKSGAVYPGIPLSQAALTVANLKLEDVVYIANSLPYAQRLEDGYSKMKAPNGIYKVAADLIKVKFKNVTVR